MSTTTTPARVEGEDVVALRAPTLGWALKRTLLAILILAVTIAGAACLLYASIEPDEEAVPTVQSPGQANVSFLAGRSPVRLAAPRRL
jgi:hypothetical protein